MSEVIVDLVKYDTKKTKKRKRKNLIVSDQTETAVIEKLEKIHKGDQVESINEIIWGEAKTKTKKDVGRKVLTGVVKFFDEAKGFGFITPDSGKEDLFFHSSALSGEKIYDDDPVEFEKSLGTNGPVAIRIKFIQEN